MLFRRGMRILAVVVLAAACATSARPRLTKTTPTPLDGLGSNRVVPFSGWNLIAYGGAIAGSGVLAAAGADHEVHIWFNRYIENSYWNETANIAGYVVPILTAPMIWMAGLASD